MDTKTVDILIKRYDHGMKLARTDYKPIDLANPTDPMASRLIKNIEGLLLSLIFFRCCQL